MSNQGWINEAREANRVINSSSAHKEKRPRGGKISVAKHVSGKQGLFMVFLKRIGEQRFFNSERVKYNKNDVWHEKRMTELYNAFKTSEEDSATLAAFRKEVSDHNNNPQAVKKHKEDIARRNRQARHENPEVYELLRSEHIRNQEEARLNASFQVPPTIENLYFREDLIAFWARRKAVSRSNMISYLSADRNTTRNAICTDAFMIHLICVVPFYYTTTEDYDSVDCYPAEISITTFNLARGIVRNSSKIVKLDKTYCFDSEILTKRDWADMLPYTSYLGFDGEGPGVEYPYEVMAWLQQEIESYPNAKLLCDRKQFNFVYYGLKCAAAYTGHNARSYYKERIATKLITIQDFTSILLDVAPLDLNRSNRWTDEDIDRQFQVFKIIARDDSNFYCHFHESRIIEVKCRCARAQNARLIHNLFICLKSNRLQGFDYSEPIHKLCYKDKQDLDLPMVFETQLTSRQEPPRDSSPERNQYRQGINVPPIEPNNDEDSDDDGDEDNDSDEGDYGVFGNGRAPPAAHQPHQPGTLPTSTFTRYPHRNHEPSPRSRDLLPLSEIQQQRRIASPEPVRILTPIAELRPPSRVGAKTPGGPADKDWENPEMLEIIRGHSASRYIQTSAKEAKKGFQEVHLDI